MRKKREIGFYVKYLGCVLGFINFSQYTEEGDERDKRFFIRVSVGDLQAH